MKKYNNIPIFIPELACPHQCVFCNQEKISGTHKVPEPMEISKFIEKYLNTIPKERIVNIAFFGGSFTGIPFDLQEQYLTEAYKFVENKKVEGIRLSTRPDYIDENILDLLEKYGVTTIELGAQSTNDEVLRRSGRGHTYVDTVNASKLIKSRGFDLGLQMMIGLPGDTFQRSYQTAQDIVKLGAENTRIYPTLVVKGTQLENLYLSGKYQPLNLEEAVQYTKSVYKLFVENNVKVIRTGLHPSEELTPENSLIAGPYHVAFKELVLTEIWKDILEKKLNSDNSSVIIETSGKQINYAVGYKKKNADEIRKRYKKVNFVVNNSLHNFDVNVSYN